MGRLIYTPGPDIKFRTGVIGKVTDEPEKTVSGAVASFDDGADNKPLHALTVDIDPVQDLHGYGEPWPPGGGVNIGNFIDGYGISTDGEVVVYSERCTTIEPIPIEAGVTYWVKKYAEGTYNFIYAVWNGDTLVRRLAGVGNEALDTSGGDRFFVCAYTGTVETIKPMLTKGPCPAVYSPYSNICPISGRTGANVSHTGKNLAKSKEVTELLNLYGIALYIDTDLLLPSTTYMISFDGTSGNKYYLNENLFSYRTFTVDSGRTIVQATTLSALDKTNVRQYEENHGWTIFKNSQAQSNAHVFDDLQLEFGSSASAYQPYQGETISVTWEDEAGTVYGGALDVLSGELTADRIFWTRNTGTMNNAENFPGWSDAGIRDYLESGVSKVMFGAISNISGTVGQTAEGKNYFAFNTINNNDIVYLPTNAWGNRNQTDWIAEALDIQIIIPLYEPVTYQLDPVEVRTLLGENHIRADTGSVSVTYPVSVRIPVIIG